MYKTIIYNKIQNGWTKHDINYESNKKFLTYEEALKNGEKIFKTRKLSVNDYEIKVYETKLI